MPAHLSYDAELAERRTRRQPRELRRQRGLRSISRAARLIVSFGADFLEGWGANVPQQLAWADARAKLADAPRFIYIGARRSLTGLNADQWVPAKPGSEVAIANALLGHLGHGTGTTLAQAADGERSRRGRAGATGQRPGCGQAEPRAGRRQWRRCDGAGPGRQCNQSGGRQRRGHDRPSPCDASRSTMRRRTPSYVRWSTA